MAFKAIIVFLTPVGGFSILSDWRHVTQISVVSGMVAHTDSGVAFLEKIRLDTQSAIALIWLNKRSGVVMGK